MATDAVVSFLSGKKADPWPVAGLGPALMWGMLLCNNMFCYYIIEAILSLIHTFTYPAILPLVCDAMLP